MGYGVQSKTLCLSETSNQDQLREKVRFIYSNVNPWEPVTPLTCICIAETPREALVSSVSVIETANKTYWTCCFIINSACLFGEGRPYLSIQQIKTATLFFLCLAVEIFEGDDEFMKKTEPRGTVQQKHH